MIEVKHYRLVRALVEAGTVSGAARALGYSQPAVTQQLRALERSLGGPVVARLTGRLQPTQIGEVVLRHGAPVEALSELTESEIGSLLSMGAGRVRIASFASAAATLVPHAMRLVRERAPEVSFSLIEAKTKRALQLVSTGEVDIALVALDSNDPNVPKLARSKEILEWIPLFTERMRLILGPADRATRSGPVSISDLHDATWIVGCPTCRKSVLYACETAGFQPRIEFETDDYIALQALSSAGFGVSLVPDLVLKITGEASLSVAETDPALSRTVYAVGSLGMLSLPATTAMIDCLHRAGRDLEITDQLALS